MQPIINFMTVTSLGVSNGIYVLGMVSIILVVLIWFFASVPVILDKTTRKGKKTTVIHFETKPNNKP